MLIQSPMKDRLVSNPHLHYLCQHMASILRVRLDFRDYLLQHPLPQDKTRICETSVFLTLCFPVTARACTDPFLFLALDAGGVLLKPILPLRRSSFLLWRIASRSESKKSVDERVR